ncbi:rod shape-determining protein MreD [Novosphingobium sp.]|uniref:rod shape-determining protein MreD n=1 Tax=Novosphingobium sp. TaxID=1874826 RepID=UPI0025E1940D|nr:rod shape-determining protein MreD [Novosphingobium sp.]
MKVQIKVPIKLPPGVPGVGKRNDGIERRINRAPSRTISNLVPWLSIVLASAVGFAPVIASAPVVPPLAFMLLLAWRTMRPGLLPVWAGLPLGAIDDLYSGQPFGSAVTIWSLAMLAMEAVDRRFLWRGFVEDWLAASVLLTAGLVMGAIVAGIAAGHVAPWIIWPQLAMSIVLFPLVTELVALLDRLRLVRVKLPEA